MVSLDIKDQSMLDIKDQVLMAIYLEDKNEPSNYEKNLTRYNLNISKKSFNSALIKLQQRGYINHLSVFYADNELANISWEKIYLTDAGEQRAEEKMNIDPALSNTEKIKKAILFFTEKGLSILVDYALRVSVGYSM